MSLSSSFLIKLNKLFPLPAHPFNMQNDGKKTYARWQFEKGQDTIKFYLQKCTKEEMFLDKTVLDVGCGAGGKSLYYASLGAKHVYGIDVVPEYEKESSVLSKELGLESVFTFIHGDAANTNFEADTFDTIIMNDAMEHVDEPDKVLAECKRILKHGGRLYVNFPPYHHPYGAHLSDAIGMPWVHLFFSDKTLIDSYKALVKPLPDGERRISFRIAKKDDGREYFSYINKMTIHRFHEILARTVKEGFPPYYYAEIPLRNFFKPLTKLPLIKEGFVKMVVCIFEKE